VFSSGPSTGLGTRQTCGMQTIYPPLPHPLPPPPHDLTSSPFFLVLCHVLQLSVEDGAVPKAVSLQCGGYFTACVADDGRLFTCGKGSSLSLGHGNKSYTPHPVLVDSLRDRKIRRLACGQKHMVRTGALGRGRGQGLMSVLLIGCGVCAGCVDGLRRRDGASRQA
jgi:hypothetical protein